MLKFCSIFYWKRPSRNKSFRKSFPQPSNNTQNSPSLYNIWASTSPLFSPPLNSSSPHSTPISPTPVNNKLKTVTLSDFTTYCKSKSISSKALSSGLPTSISSFVPKWLLYGLKSLELKTSTWEKSPLKSLFTLKKILNLLLKCWNCFIPKKSTFKTSHKTTPSLSFIPMSTLSSSGPTFWN